MYSFRGIRLILHGCFHIKALIQSNQCASIAESIAFNIVAQQVTNGGIFVHMRQFIVIAPLHLQRLLHDLLKRYKRFRECVKMQLEKRTFYSSNKLLDCASTLLML